MGRSNGKRQCAEDATVLSLIGQLVRTAAELEGSSQANNQVKIAVAECTSVLAGCRVAPDCSTIFQDACPTLQLLLR